VGGRPAMGSVTLESPAPEGGVTLTLMSSQPAVAQVPVNVRIAPGIDSATFPLTTTRVRAVTGVTLSATAEAGVITAPLTVIPAGMSALTVKPASVVGGHPATGAVTLALPAPAEGALVALATDKPAAAMVPPQVTVPAGARSVLFTV